MPIRSRLPCRAHTLRLTVYVLSHFVATRWRKDTFFGDGIVAHVPFSEPTCSVLREMLLESCKEAKCAVHPKGTYVNMEGPAFSTIAESNLHRSWGGDVIGMTAVAEAKLCREAEISYAVLAMATDYDCWKEEEEAVTVEAVIATLQANVKKAQEVVKLTVPKIAKYTGEHPQTHAMASAIMTTPDIIPKDRAVALRPLIEKYVDPRCFTNGSGEDDFTNSLLIWGMASLVMTMLH